MATPSGANGAAGITMAQMQRHLDGTFIGYRPGDPTAAAPPATMPRPVVPPPPSLKTINLGVMSQAELSTIAAATLTRDCFAVLLPNPPGVPVDRLAYVTGQAPARADGQQQGQQEQQQHKPQQVQQQQQQVQQQQVQPPARAAVPAAQAARKPALAGAAANGSALTPAPPRTASQPPSDAEIVAILSRHLKRRPGSQEDSRPPSSSPEAISWQELGMAKGGPRMMGVECDLRRLWDLVYMDRGGFEQVSSPAGWSVVAQEMGANLMAIRNAGHVVMQWYKRFLLPLERHLDKGSS